MHHYALREVVNKMDYLNAMNALEITLDEIAKNRAIGQAQSIPLLNQYYDNLLTYIKFINGIPNNERLTFENLKVKPFNIEERLRYIHERKHHYMGYQQMKTVKSELIKMNAAYKAKHSSL